MKAFLSALAGVLFALLLIIAVAAMWYAAVFLGALIAIAGTGWFVGMAIWDYFFDDDDNDEKKPP